MSSHGGGGFKIPILSGAKEWLEGEDINYGGVVAIFGVIFIGIVLFYAGVSQSKMVVFAFLTAPLWLPYITFHIFFSKWSDMVGMKFSLNSGRTVFEIKLPPDVFKSPEAMEFVFTQVSNAASPDNLMETYLDGKRPLFYSVELVSRGGDVHFYAVIPNKFIYGFTDNMYAQYPGVEVVKLEVDYTAELPHSLNGWAFMSFIFNKKKDEVFPIKTYIDFGMDKLPKEEEKVDPMTPMLEMLAGIKPHQQLWIQFLFKAHREQNFKLGQLHVKDTWDGKVKEKINEIMGRDKEKKAMVEFEGMVKLTTGERDMVDAMERNVGKAAFEFVCRTLYMSNKENDYDGGLYSRMIRSFAQTEIKGRNGLGMKWRTDFNYNFISDPFYKIRPRLKREELHHYKARDYHGSTYIMTAEEMATIFHLPGKVALTPTLNRVPSTRGEAPSNLPTGVLPI